MLSSFLEVILRFVFPGAGVKPSIGILTVESFQMGEEKKWYSLDLVLELGSLAHSKSDWEIGGFWVVSGTRIPGRMMMMCFFLIFCYANLKSIIIEYIAITQYLSISVIGLTL